MKNGFKGRCDAISPLGNGLTLLFTCMPFHPPATLCVAMRAGHSAMDYCSGILANYQTGINPDKPTSLIIDLN